ncbi:MAG: KUP/HAK/KT family potassium transporter [Bacteroidales bacterium]
MKTNAENLKKVSFSGLLITLGIVFGDIGTSPLYVMRAIMTNRFPSPEFVTGAVSCIIWTLTLQTTIKYVLITLRADNKGEGGILALFALLRKKKTSLYILALVGASTLLADGVITPSITVTSAVEGLLVLNPNISVIPIVIAILLVLFTIQQFGTNFIGKSFGPIMFIWFTTLGVLGFSQILRTPEILKAFNPVYAFRLLVENPKGILILGAVFLCTTGAEALYSDLGHCGIRNIRTSWIFVKLTLVLNYLGQGAWVISQHSNNLQNPFYAIMPDWFILPGIILATVAAIIASQALISGSYTIVSEAITLNFWPKVLIKYPTKIKGQLYIPSVNWLLLVACSLVVLFFQNSSNMEAAYGLSITLTMLMTTLLLYFYFDKRHVSVFLRWCFLIFYITVEGVFLVANLHKFYYGGWFTIFLAGLLLSVMFIWNRARLTKKKFTEFLVIGNYIDVLKDLHDDKAIPLYSSNLVYITRADNEEYVEAKIIYSILNKQPKRAERYWLLRINITDEPYTKNYTVNKIIPGVLFRVDFYLGYKVDARINRYFNQVITEMVLNKEISIISSYRSLNKHGIAGDFRYIIIDRIQTVDINLTSFERFIMNAYEVVKKFSISNIKAYGLDTSNVTIEQVPLGISKSIEPEFQRIN